MTSWFLSYTRPMAPPGAISLVVSPEHGALLRVAGPIFGIDLPKRPEIGRYRSSLRADELGRLRDLVLSAVDEASAARSRPVLPGTMFLEFGYHDPAQKIDKSASCVLRAPFPPAVARLDDAMLGVAKRALGHPVATLEGIASFRDASISPGQELELTLALRNSGTVPITIHNPAAAESDDRVGLELLLEKDLPEEELEDSDSIPLTLKHGEVSQRKTPGVEGDVKAMALVSLAPKQELILTLKIRRHLFLGAGAYRAYVTYSSPTEGIPDDEAVEGSLEVPASKFRVQGRR